MREWFDRFARWTAHWTGSPSAFVVAVAVILIWAFTGPVFAFSDTWQLVINTGTTIVTFLMVFVIQQAQNRESMAVQIKLNELIASLKGASNRLINIEEMSETDVQRLHDCYTRLAERLQCEKEHCRHHSIEEAYDSKTIAAAKVAEARRQNDNHARAN